MVDTADLKSAESNLVPVRVRPAVHIGSENNRSCGLGGFRAFCLSSSDQLASTAITPVCALWANSLTLCYGLDGGATLHDGASAQAPVIAELRIGTPARVSNLTISTATAVTWLSVISKRCICRTIPWIPENPVCGGNFTVLLNRKPPLRRYLVSSRYSEGDSTPSVGRTLGTCGIAPFSKPNSTHEFSGAS